MIVVPLIHNGETVGVLKVASKHPAAFANEDLATLELMAGVLSTTLRDAAASEALQDSHKSLSTINKLLQMQKAQLEYERVKLKTQADTDGMTGLKNHRYFQEILHQEYSNSLFINSALSLVLIDVDYFKPFNDQFGHPAGDEVLKQVALILAHCVRPSDCVARYGGEEFAILLIGASMHDAALTARRIQDAIRNAVWDKRSITVSIGISGMENNADDALSLLTQADKALYQSKLQGRNRTTLFKAPASFSSHSLSIA